MIRFLFFPTLPYPTLYCHAPSYITKHSPPLPCPALLNSILHSFALFYLTLCLCLSMFGAGLIVRCEKSEIYSTRIETMTTITCSTPLTYVHKHVHVHVHYRVLYSLSSIIPCLLLSLRLICLSLPFSLVHLRSLSNACHSSQCY